MALQEIGFHGYARYMQLLQYLVALFAKKKIIRWVLYKKFGVSDLTYFVRPQKEARGG